MKLRDIIKNQDAAIFGDENVEVCGLSHQSDKVNIGDMFFCLKGKKDGHDFALDAVKNGAQVIVSEKRLNLPNGVQNVVTGNCRKLMALCACNFYNNPANQMTIIAVTGTNGKTTSCYMIDSIFRAAGYNTGVIGTNGIFINGEHFESNMTTPDPIELQKNLAKMLSQGVNVVIMEMSAHALFYQKNRGLMCDIVVFTNLTEDHLDFFLNMKDYGEAKKRLFTKDSAKFAVINLDDSFANNIIESIDIPYITISQNKESDIKIQDLECLRKGQDFTFIDGNNKCRVHINLDGKFNVSNALGAIAVAKLCAICNSNIAKGLANLKTVPGRFNTLLHGGRKFIVDYAHTPDGLKNILKATRELLNGKGKLISVFGCGGNRDTLKRPIMGSISTSLADVTIITSDNPRLENPEEIIKQIETGVKKDSVYIIEKDREKAIEFAYNIATIDDIIVVSGKGAENYIDIGGQKIDYLDAKVIEKLKE